MRFICIYALMFCLISLPSAFAAEEKALEVGVRGGAIHESGRNHYTSVEVYMMKNMTWKASLSDSIKLKTRFDAGIGYLDAEGDYGGWLAMGVNLVLSFDGLVEFETGFRPTLLPVYEFGDEHYGGIVQFSSHAGLAFNWNDVILSYRMQHISNAGIYSKNPA
jgi:hypothetical protein